MKRLVSILAAAFLVGSCQRRPIEIGAAAKSAVVLGVVLPLSGGEATYGTAAREGLELASTVIGQVSDGSNLSIKIYDDHSKADEASEMATRLISEDHASVLIGEITSRHSLMMALVAEKFGVPLLVPSGTHPRITQNGELIRRYVFRVCFGTSLEARAMGQFAKETLHLTRAGVFFDSTSSSSEEAARQFTQSFRSDTAAVVEERAYESDDTDFKAQLTALRARSIDSLFLPGAYKDVALIVRQAKEMGLKPRWLGLDPWDSSQILAGDDALINGAYYSVHYARDDRSHSAARRFAEEFTAKYAHEPDSTAALFYDAALLVNDALRRAAPRSSEGIRNALETTSGFSGVTGISKFDTHHNPVKPVAIVQVQGGLPRYLTSVSVLSTQAEQ